MTSHPMDKYKPWWIESSYGPSKLGCTHTRARATLDYVAHSMINLSWVCSSKGTHIIDAHATLQVGRNTVHHYKLCSTTLKEIFQLSKCSGKLRHPQVLDSLDDHLLLMVSRQ